ncbi:MAG: glycosyltransferase [Planctomycetales bacterium]|nr:glycosyltransferase [Planctomycetales bacterium]
MPGGYPVTLRSRRLGAWPNWLLAGMELYQGDPHATAYALFQDDVLAVNNLREWLEQTPWPDNSYLNLYTSRHNGRGAGWFAAPSVGRGALGLVFGNKAMRALLEAPAIHRHRLTNDGHKRIDVVVASTLASLGIQEHVHDPSPLQHRVASTSPVPWRNSTLGHNFNAMSDCFPGEETDARSWIVASQRDGDRPRVGLVGFNTASGIGACNRDLARRLKVDQWLVVPHRHHPEMPFSAPELVKRCAGRHDMDAFRNMCEAVDVVLTVETQFIERQIAIAREHGVKTICIPMLEWLPRAGWPSDVDQFLCPTRDCLETLAKEHPGRCRLVSWPVDTDLFTFTERHVCRRFLFVNGHGGHCGRKGGDVIRAAAELAPEATIIVFDQTGSSWPKSCDVRGEAADSLSLYGEGDVLLLPARFNGIGLEQLEAMASGLPVIATDHPPMTEAPLLGRIRCTTRQESTRRPRAISVADPDPRHLARLMQVWMGREIGEQSRAARQFAESRSWDRQLDRFEAAIQELVR